MPGGDVQVEGRTEFAAEGGEVRRGREGRSFVVLRS